MVPKGVKAVALLFPCAGVIAAKRKEEDSKIQTSGQEPIDPGVFWMKQTVGTGFSPILTLQKKVANVRGFGRFQTPAERWD